MNLSDCNRITPESLIEKINELGGLEISLPGNWSPNLFCHDFGYYLSLDSSHPYPKFIIQEFINFLNSSDSTSLSYLNFYRNIYDQDHPTLNKTPNHRLIWEIFSSGVLMLQFEKVFIRMIQENNLNSIDRVLLQYLEVLGKTPLNKWDSIVSKIGACCRWYFIQDPESYSKLIFRTNSENIEQKTDQEILDSLNLSLVLGPGKGKISYQDSRQDLINLYHNIKRKNPLLLTV